MIKSRETVVIEMNGEILIKLRKNSLFQPLNCHLIKNLENLFLPRKVFNFHLSSVTIDKSVNSNGPNRNQINNFEFTVVVNHHVLGNQFFFAENTEKLWELRELRKKWLFKVGLGHFVLSFQRNIFRFFVFEEEYGDVLVVKL